MSKSNLVQRSLSLTTAGYNTTLTLRTHKGTIPSIPQFGAALSGFSADLPTPKLKPPMDPDHPDDPPDDDEGPHFIADATVRPFILCFSCLLDLPISDAPFHVDCDFYTTLTIVT